MSAIAGDETIAAVATAQGRGAIAIIRISGPSAFTIARQHVAPWPAVQRQATLCTLRDNDGDLLDEALVTTFTAPSSFTGEDVVEISTHGGAVVPTLVLAALVASGARIAQPGEFTRRAVLNGKLDLVQAEAIGDLIDSTSRAMQRVAIKQLDGGLSRRINELRDSVIDLEALIAYDIDFPDEDDGPISRVRIEAATGAVVESLTSLLETTPAGELIRTGALVVIAGAPNVGKSSLFNAMLGRSRAIVTEMPGTTRDAIEAVLDSRPWPIRLVDTAGLRETVDVIEQMGIEVATRYLGSADVILACGETSEDVAATSEAIARTTDAPVISVRTKADLMGSTDAGAVSALTGQGVRELLDSIMVIISEHHRAVPLDAPILFRERQRFCVELARDEMTAFQSALKNQSLPVSVAAVHLRSAADALADVTGTVDVEDVLDRLFRTFCVGK
ncbi:MAG TPA: tRNA uridine-5-carboxymethylaminomethyl(34) synthesis GTPase MnmE [Gemmatimonadaceae bacterium]